MMNDTPRTNAECAVNDECGRAEQTMVSAEFARGLQREIAILKGDLPRIHASPPRGLVLTLPDGSQALFIASCEIAEQMIGYLSGRPFKVVPESVPAQDSQPK